MLSNKPTAIRDHIPQNPCISELSNGSSISYLSMTLLVDVYIIDPIIPMIAALQRDTLALAAVILIKPASTPPHS